jgi:hypothetical protein
MDTQQVLELLLARMETMQVMADAVRKEMSAETRMQQGHKEPRTAFGCGLLKTSFFGSQCKTDLANVLPSHISAAVATQ